MAPSAPIMLALMHSSNAHLDEQSMLQMPVMDRSVATDNSDCRCPGYYQEQCLANAFQGCIWAPAHGSNEHWCACDPNFVPEPPLYTNQADPNAQAPAAACPVGWVQKGEIGADIGGCGLQTCGERYDILTVEACAARCDGHADCEGFSFAPMNGDRNHPGVSACTIYNSDTPTGTWTGTEGIPTQVMCGRAPSTPAVPSAYYSLTGRGWDNGMNDPNSFTADSPVCGISFRCNTPQSHLMIGPSTQQVNAWQDIGYGATCRGAWSNDLDLFVYGSHVHSEPNRANNGGAADDVIAIKVNANGYPEFSINGNIIYTSTRQISYPWHVAVDTYQAPSLSDVEYIPC